MPKQYFGGEYVKEFVISFITSNAKDYVTAKTKSSQLHKYIFASKHFNLCLLFSPS